MFGLANSRLGALFTLVALSFVSFLFFVTDCLCVLWLWSSSSSSDSNAHKSLESYLVSKLSHQRRNLPDKISKQTGWGIMIDEVDSILLIALGKPFEIDAQRHTQTRAGYQIWSRQFSGSTWLVESNGCNESTIPRLGCERKVDSPLRNQIMSDKGRDK